MADYAGKLVTILNYKPLELTTKLRSLIKQEAAAIGAYDIMFYSEVTKDLEVSMARMDLVQVLLFENHMRMVHATAFAGISFGMMNEDFDCRRVLDPIVEK